ENQDLTEFIDILHEKNEKDIKPDSNDTKLVCRAYMRAIKTTVSNLQRYMKFDTVFHLHGSRLYVEDKKILNSIRRNIYNENYSHGIYKINSLLKNKLIEFIYSITCLFYGTSKWRRGLPLEINKEISESWIDADSKIILKEFTITELLSILIDTDEIIEIALVQLFTKETLDTFRNSLFIQHEFHSIGYD
ncbi:unnamed protein product, partial [marine sediment metagenome]